MYFENTRLVNIWKATAEILNGKFSMPFQWYNGGSSEGGLFLFCIDINYRNVEIKIEAGILELPLRKDEYTGCIITISALKNSVERIELSIWRKDFLDRIFKIGNTKTGYKDFDKIIGLKASRNIGRNLPKLFENRQLREEFMNDRYRVFNISTSDNVITIRRKSNLFMENSKMIQSEYENFCIFIDSLIDSTIL